MDFRAALGFAFGVEGAVGGLEVDAGFFERTREAEGEVLRHTERSGAFRCEPGGDDFGGGRVLVVGFLDGFFGLRVGVNEVHRRLGAGAVDFEVVEENVFFSGVLEVGEGIGRAEAGGVEEVGASIGSGEEEFGARHSGSLSFQF